MTTTSEQLPIEDDDFENSSDKVSQKKKPGKIGSFILNHKMNFFLLCALLVVFLWANIKIGFMETEFENRNLAQKALLENRMDSLMTIQLELTTNVLSWAIRSELTRENKEQVNQFFSSFIKERNVNKIKLVDATTARVLLSTDKKDEGLFFADPVLMTDKTIHQNKDSVLRVISPVMGLNKRIGILDVEYALK